VSRRRNRERQQGDARPKSWGGGRRSDRIEAHKEMILAMLKAAPDLAIEELRRRLAEKRLVFGEGTAARNHAQKRRRTPASRNARTS
jgi:hypothetical protein